MIFLSTTLTNIHFFILLRYDGKYMTDASTHAKTILIKLSGEALSRGGAKYSEEVLRQVADHISELLRGGARIALVVGAGNLFRGRDLAGSLGIERATGDYIGMLATVQNALVLRDYFESRGLGARILSSIAMPQITEPYIPARGKRHMDKERASVRRTSPPTRPPHSAHLR